MKSEVEVPDGWELVELSDICTSIKDIDHKMPKKQEMGIPFISVKNIVNSSSIDFVNVDYISSKDYKHHSKRFKPEKYDLVYTRFGTIGYSRLVETDNPFIASYSVVLIKPVKEKINPFYLNNWLNSEFVRKRVKLKVFGSANKNLHMEHILKIKVLKPPIKEQQKIADILSKVDEQIDFTEKIIDKTEELKKGLMQKLLTKGIGHTKFQKTELGEMPEEWDVVRIKDSPIKIIDGDRGKNYPKSSDFKDSGYCIFLNTGNIRNDSFSFDKCNFISKEKDDLLRMGKLTRSDVILTTRGTVGNVAFYEDNIKYENIRYLLSLG